MHQLLIHFCALLEHNSIIVALSDSVVFYELLELLHFTGFFLLVGTIAILDLRAMGVASRKQGLAALAKQLFPWMWLGLLLTLASGFLMFPRDGVEWRPYPSVPSSWLSFRWCCGLARSLQQSKCRLSPVWDNL